MDLYKDNYEEPNYRRLFLLFLLFLASLYYRLGGAAESYVSAANNENYTHTPTRECLIVGLNTDCNVEEE